MVIVTYILLTALYSGINARFFPQVCASRPQRYKRLILLFSDSRQISLSCKSRRFLRFLFCLVGLLYAEYPKGSSQVIDIVAYGGYKFVG